MCLDSLEQPPCHALLRSAGSRWGWIAQAQDAGEFGYIRIVFWSLALIGLILALFAAITYFKRRWMVPDEPGGSGFSLADLRALRRQGKMSEEEFERARALILASYKRAQALEGGSAIGRGPKLPTVPDVGSKLDDPSDPPE